MTKMTRRTVLAGSAALLAAPYARAAAEKLALRLEWSLTGYHLPYYWAAAKGYYTAAGLDVDIKQGSGSQQTINLVGGGHDDIGLADYSLMTSSAAKGMAVKAIFGVVQGNAWTVFSYMENPLRKPEDLIGKSIVCISDHKPMLDLLLKLNNIDASRVQIRVTSPSSRNTVFAQRAVDGILAISLFSSETFTPAGVEPPPLATLELGEYGVKLLGQGLIANRDFLANNSDRVRRFLAATSHAFQDVMQPDNLEEALDITLKATNSGPERRPGAKHEWLATIPRLHTANSKDKPLGWTALEDWRDTVEVVRTTGRITDPVTVEDLFTNDLLS